MYFIIVNASNDYNDVQASWGRKTRLVSWHRGAVQCRQGGGVGSRLEPPPLVFILSLGQVQTS
jgi:hypothetical protein